jgi:hypothetical protein
MRALEGLLGAVEVTSDVPGAEIAVDGHPVGQTPSTVRVTSGTHHIEIRLTGYASEMREVELAVRQTVRLEITLHVVSDFEGLEPWVFWASTGIAVAALISGVAVGIAALLDSQSTSAIDTMARTQEDRDRIAGLALTADVLYGVAGLFGATSLVLAFLTDWDGHGTAAPAETAWRLVPYGTPSSFGVSAQGRF